MLWATFADFGWPGRDGDVDRDQFPLPVQIHVANFLILLFDRTWLNGSRHKRICSAGLPLTGFSLLLLLNCMAQLHQFGQSRIRGGTFGFHDGAIGNTCTKVPRLYKQRRYQVSSHSAVYLTMDLPADWCQHLQTRTPLMTSTDQHQLHLKLLKRYSSVKGLM